MKITLDRRNGGYFWSISEGKYFICRGWKADGKMPILEYVNFYCPVDKLSEALKTILEWANKEEQDL